MNCFFPAQKSKTSRSWEDRKLTKEEADALDFSKKDSTSDNVSDKQLLFSGSSAGAVSTATDAAVAQSASDELTSDVDSEFEFDDEKTDVVEHGGSDGAAAAADASKVCFMSACFLDVAA